LCQCYLKQNIEGGLINASGKKKCFEEIIIWRTKRLPDTIRLEEKGISLKSLPT
jgi:hypothetical protein